MLGYKRNQVEEAISRVLDPRSAKPSSELRTRLKRLLEADRSLGRTSRSANPERLNYAFYSADSPGRGVEIWFSEYEAFALLTGLRILEHGWPQGFVVAALRRARGELEQHHARILRQDPEKLFDWGLIKGNARPGDLAFDNTDPVFLTIVSGESQADEGRVEPPGCAVCRGQQEVAKFVRQQGAQSYSMFELATAAHRLSQELSKAEPRKRGRSG